MKKILCAVLAVILLFSLQIFPTAYADECSDLCQMLVSSYANNKKVDISRFGLNEDALDAAFVDLWYSGRLPWNGYSYSYSLTESGVVSSFAPIYYDKAEYDYDRYEQAVKALIEQAITEDMTQWEKALAVHDYLIVNSQYDETLQRNTNYDLLVNGTAVCSGYAMAYLDIMTRLGIECRFVESQPMEHAWNMVKIDGNWYHVDVTHDDPTPDSYGYVSHEHFLKTDKEMEDLGYYGWNNGISCTDETFADPLWKNIYSMIIFTDQAIYMRVQQGYKCTITCQSRDLSGTSTDLFAFSSQTLINEEMYYSFETDGLSMWDGRLWFSGMNRVWSMLPDGSDLQTVLRYDIKNKRNYIYSSYMKDGILYMSLSDGLQLFDPQIVALEDSPEHTHDYEEIKQDATCMQAGGTVYLCQCGRCYDGDSIPALDHIYDTYTSKLATCQQAGEKTFVCSVCSNTYTEDFTDPNAHNYESVVISKASLFKEGLTKSTCNICGHIAEEPIARLTVESITGMKPWILICVLVLLIGIPLLIVSRRDRRY